MYRPFVFLLVHSLGHFFLYNFYINKEAHMSRKITKQDMQKQLNTLSLTELLGMLNTYSKANKTDISKYTKHLVNDDWQNRLINSNINTNCPHCGSSTIIKKGTRANGIKEFQCKECKKKFTLFTNTILEKTQYHYDIWIHVLKMVLNGMPTEHIHKNLIDDFGLDGLDYKTVFLWKHKLINAMANMPMPKLSGIVQIDETFFRESQKGSRDLESFVKGEDRLPRYGRRSSHYGVMGNEWANVVCMVDLNGYAVAKVVGLGRLDIKTFTELFDEHLDNPSFICADGNKIYRQYCDLKKIPLYVKPSNYVKTINDNGYKTPVWSNPTLAAKQEAKNEKILTKLYKEESIDYIYNRTELDYKDFYHLKNLNSLSLARVNQYHSELKEHLVKKTKGVSTKYLQDYIGFYTFKRNWRVANGEPPTTLEDAKSIFEDILRGHTTYTVVDMENSKLDIPKTSDRYMELLKQKTKEARRLTLNPYFKFDEEDNVVSFDKRKYLDSLSDKKINDLCRKYKIKQSWNRRPKITALLKEPTIGDEIILLINEDKHLKIAKEDEEVINALKYVS